MLSAWPGSALAASGPSRPSVPGLPHAWGAKTQSGALGSVDLRGRPSSCTPRRTAAVRSSGGAKENRPPPSQGGGPPATRGSPRQTPCLPWRFRGVTRVHVRSLATQFLLQIGLILTPEMCRGTTRVSFLMCPFCVGYVADADNECGQVTDEPSPRSLGCLARGGCRAYAVPRVLLCATGWCRGRTGA